MKLTAELVPKTCWYTNVRSNVPERIWDIIRKACYKKANHKCEICTETGLSQGYNHPVECHEIWVYDDVNKKQILKGFISLCPLCHKVKHPGLANIKGESELVIKQLMKVNGINRKEALNHLDESFTIWQEKSNHQWILDISYADLYVVAAKLEGKELFPKKIEYAKDVLSKVDKLPEP